MPATEPDVHLLVRCMQIYHASEVYGLEDIRTSGGYFHLGKVFHELSRDDVAEAMFDMVSHSHTTHCITRIIIMC